MADILLDTEAAPATPAAGQVVIFPETSTKQLTSKDANGLTLSMPGIVNASTADLTVAAVDIYVAGSNLAVPAHGLNAGTIFRWRFVMTKTAAGVASPVVTVRVGTAGTTADTA